MRLNPKKCAFGVGGGTFLGFMLSHRGIQANLTKCQAVIDCLLNKISAQDSRKRQNHHELDGKKQKKKIKWDHECVDAFQALKIMLATPPLLAKPNPQEKLIIYPLVFGEAVNATAVQEHGEAPQRIYFIS